MGDDFAIVPESEIKELKEQISSIRRNPLGPYGGQELVESINNLTKAINSLIQLFETAAEELKLEQRESELIVRKIDPLLSRIEAISEQNRKIAQGIVAVADMLEAAKIEGKTPFQQLDTSMLGAIQKQPPQQVLTAQTPPPRMPIQTSGSSPSPITPQFGQAPLSPQQPQPPSGTGIPTTPKLPPVPPPKKKGLFG
ncbi:MAG: hypothetical protein QXG86_00790 [Candidatus Woesearchaeota archaeon]